jgi:hypothetical protein
MYFLFSLSLWNRILDVRDPNWGMSFPPPRSGTQLVPLLPHITMVSVAAIWKQPEHCEAILLLMERNRSFCSVKSTAFSSCLKPWILSDIWQGGGGQHDTAKRENMSPAGFEPAVDDSTRLTWCNHCAQQPHNLPSESWSLNWFLSWCCTAWPVPLARATRFLDNTMAQTGTGPTTASTESLLQRFISQPLPSDRQIQTTHSSHTVILRSLTRVADVSKMFRALGNCCKAWGRLQYIHKNVHENPWTVPNWRHTQNMAPGPSCLTACKVAQWTCSDLTGCAPSGPRLFGAQRNTSLKKIRSMTTFRPYDSFLASLNRRGNNTYHLL